MNIANIIIRAWLRLHRVKWAGASPACSVWGLPRFSIHRERGSRISMGSHCRFGGGAELCAWDGASVELGRSVSVNSRARIVAAQGASVRIGDGSRIASGALIISTAFHPVAQGEAVKAAPISIGRNCWVASNAIVLPGVSIGDHSVVAAGAVVSHDVPGRCVVAGSPARVVKTFECEDDWRRP